MKPQGIIGYLLITAFLFTLWGCEATYAYLPSRSKPAVAPTEAVEGTPAPAPVPSAPEARPDVNQQVQALEARVQRLESQLAEQEQRQGYPAAVKTPAAKPAAKTVPAPPATSAAAGSQDKGFQDGMRLYNAKKYGSAREKFAHYLKAHPQGAKASDSRYYLAESFYQEKKYKEAAVEYNKLVNQHGQSILAPAAMLRQALCYHNLQQKQNYQATLKKLVKAYPQSAEAKEAQKWLKPEGR